MDLPQSLSAGKGALAWALSLIKCFSGTERQSQPTTERCPTAAQCKLWWHQTNTGHDSWLLHHRTTTVPSRTTYSDGLIPTCLHSVLSSLWSNHELFLNMKWHSCTVNTAACSTLNYILIPDLVWIIFYDWHVTQFPLVGNMLDTTRLSEWLKFVASWSIPTDSFWH